MAGEGAQAVAGRRGTWLSIALALVVSAMLTELHVRILDRPNLDEQERLHAAIIDHAAPAPYQYRILQPVLVEFMARALGRRAEGNLFLVLYAAIRLACLGATLVGFFLFLRRWFAADRAALGTMIVAAVIPFTYLRYYYQPTSVMEWALFALGLHWTAGRRRGWLTAAVLVGTLNRETTIFLPALYVLWWWREMRRSDYLTVGLGIAGWAAVFFGLRAIWPAAESATAVQRYVHHNLSYLLGNLDVVLMTVPWLVASVLAGAGTFRRILWLYAPWAALHFLYSQWAEVRYWLPMLMVTIPGVLCTLFPSGRPSSPTREGREVTGP